MMAVNVLLNCQSATDHAFFWDDILFTLHSDGRYTKDRGEDYTHASTLLLNDAHTVGRKILLSGEDG